MEESPVSMPLATTAIAVFIIFVSLLRITLSLVTNKRSAHGVEETAPIAGGSRPLLGHLHLLAGPIPTHLVLAKMADDYGPIFTIKLGITKAVVVNTWEVAKECVTTNDRAFATRPKAMGSEILAYNYAMLGFSPYGPYWRHVRKVTTLELLSNHRIGLLRHVRESEVLASVREIYEQRRKTSIENNKKDDPPQAEQSPSPMLVDLKKWFSDISVNITFRTIVGKRYSDEGEGDEVGRKALRDWIELIGMFVVSDGLPFLRWLDLGGYEKAMKKTAKNLDRMLQRWLDEHKARRNTEEYRAKGDQDFMDALLTTLDGNTETSSYDSDTINKATCMGMVLAGTDTSTVTMTWAISLLLNHKESLKKVQQELDARIGPDRRVNDSDIWNLPYLQAVIKETLRLYPPVPLNLPRAAFEDCCLSGYSVSKGTRLVLNIYKIQRDPRIWPEPSAFRPERFLTSNKDVDFRGRNFEFLPFGGGRRICPGISMAIQVIGLSLGSFLHAFDIRAQGDGAIDMEEAIGLTNLKASPLEVLVTPRVPEGLYM